MTTSHVAQLAALGWHWAGMGYRPNGDGYATFRHVSGQRVRVGAGEAGWTSGDGSYKEAAHRALLRRLERNGLGEPGTARR